MATISSLTRLDRVGSDTEVRGWIGREGGRVQRSWSSLSGAVFPPPFFYLFIFISTTIMRACTWFFYFFIHRSLRQTFMTVMPHSLTLTRGVSGPPPSCSGHTTYSSESAGPLSFPSSPCRRRFLSRNETKSKKNKLEKNIRRRVGELAMDPFSLLDG